MRSSKPDISKIFARVIRYGAAMGCGLCTALVIMLVIRGVSPLCLISAAKGDQEILSGEKSCLVPGIGGRGLDGGK